MKDTSLSPRVSPQSELLEALAARCEREEPSRELDAAIQFKLTDKAGIMGITPYTTSLDAAVTLVPIGDDVFWRLGHDGEGPDPSVFKAEVLVCSQPTPANGHVARSDTPTLALCAAALRARAALAGNVQASDTRSKGTPS